MRKVTLVLWAAAIVVMGSESAGAQDFCIRTTLQSGGSRNFSASIMSVVGSTVSITVIDLASVNAIGFGALNVNFWVPGPADAGLDGDRGWHHGELRLQALRAFVVGRREPAHRAQHGEYASAALAVPDHAPPLLKAVSPRTP